MDDITQSKQQSAIVLVEPPLEVGSTGYIAAADKYEEVCKESSMGALLLFYCTRGKGHEGDHVAHGPANEMLARWAQ